MEMAQNQMNQLKKLLVEWEVMWKPLFFKLIKNILLARQIKILKFKKGILRNFEATEGLNTSNKNA
jgi:hypothetical protein